MIKVSFIVPVYNTEKYLAKCLDSILNQTLKEIEVLVINDGTPDNSQEIIDQYAKKDNRIKPFIKENGGLSDARNYGIERAKGKYIWFIDSDDYLIRDTACETFYNFTKVNDLDIAVSDYVQETEDGSSIITQKSAKLLDELYDGRTYLKESYKTGWYKKFVWTNLYKRDFIDKKNFRFEKGRVYEDWLWTPKAFYEAERVMCIDNYFCYYRYNSNSITREKFNKQNYIDKIYILNKFKELFKEIDDKELKQLLYKDMANNYLYTVYILNYNKSRYKYDMILDNIKGNKTLEYKLALYKFNNVFYFFMFRIWNMIKGILSKRH